MGRPQADPPSSYQPDFPQMEQQADPHAEQYHYEPESHDAIGDPNEISPVAYENHYNEENPQGNVPINQEQFQPPQPSQPPQYPPQNPPQQFQPPQPSQPPQYPPQNPQPNPAYPTQPSAYPQRNDRPPQPFPPQPNPQPFPPQPNPQSYPPQPNPQSYPPQPNPQPYPPQPVQFPPRNYPPQPLSPHKPAGPQNVAASGIPVFQPYPQPTPVQTQNRIPGNPGTVGWHTGLFDCMEDPTNALVTAFFPCLTFGQVAEIVDNGHTTCGTSGLLYGGIAFLIALPCLLSCTYRTKLRNKYDLVESPAPDWVTHFLCEWCALCQEYRELQRRGLDPSIGWQGNVLRSQQQQQQGAMTPPKNQTMMG